MKKELLLTTTIPDLSESGTRFISEIRDLIVMTKKSIREEGRYKAFYMTISGLYDIKLEAMSKRRNEANLSKYVDKIDYPFGVNPNETYVPLLVLYADNPLFSDYLCYSTAERKDATGYLINKECEVSIYGIISPWYETKTKIKNFLGLDKQIEEHEKI